MLYLHGATILTPHQQIGDGAVLIEGARITACGRVAEVPRPPSAQTFDASGLILCPGFIDLQINGAYGHDFTADPEAIWPVAALLPRHGVTAFLPTIITSPLETVAAAQEVVRRSGPDTGSVPLGLHVEGPFLNPAKKGAHNPDYLRTPDPGAICDWSPDCGVRLVTLAPELPGALDLVATLAGRGVVVSAGHSAATYDQALSGLDAGIRYGTHLFNAMPPLHHRDPGLAGALLMDARATVGMMADAVHVHPAVNALAWRILGSRRLSLVTDTMAALGMPPGRHVLGDYEVIVDGGRARLADGTLAGSLVSLDTTLRNLIKFTGCSLVEALPTVTATPATVLGMGTERGSIAPGQIADLVILTAELRVHTTIVAGRIAFQDQGD